MSNPTPDFYVPPSFIYRGGWTNWNGNPNSGGQITVTKKDADLLMVFVGIFFVFAEAGLWSLVTFGLFLWRRRSNLEPRQGGSNNNSNKPVNAPRDALWHQQQAILRNAGDDRTVGRSYLSLWLTHGWRDPKTALRTLPTAVAAVVSFLVFLVALPFVAAYAMLDNQANEVLIKSPRCGWWQADFSNDFVVASTDVANRTREGLQYADTCYENDAPAALCDDFLMQRSIRWTAWHNTACPFGEAACLTDGAPYPGFQMESMLIDSHKDLGLNAPESGRFALRHTVTCAPLDVAAFSEVRKGRITGENITEVYFGNTSSTLFTYGVSSLQASRGIPGYNLIAYTSYPTMENESVETFTPIKELRRDDADVSIMLLNNNNVNVAGTDGPCRDPFFSATKTQSRLYKEWYLPDSPLTAIACADQYALYNPTTKTWTNDTGLLKIGFDETGKTGLSERQWAARGSILMGLGQIGATGRLVEVVGAEALRAAKYPGVFNYYQNPLPDSQWKSEAAHWFNARLAMLQLHFVRVATGPRDSTSAFVDSMDTASDAAGHDFRAAVCGAQKIHDGEYKNFHRGGFVALAVIGATLIVLPLVLIWGVMFWGRHWDRRFVLEWASYGNLQLLRMAHEGAGVDGWKGAGREVPWAEGGGKIASLDVEARVDGEVHPRFVKAPAAKPASITATTTSGTQQVDGQDGGGTGGPRRGNTFPLLDINVQRPSTDSGGPAVASARPQSRQATC